MGTIWSSYTSIICFKKMEYIDIIVLKFFLIANFLGYIYVK